jgi:hypothetical protein
MSHILKTFGDELRHNNCLDEAGAFDAWVKLAENDIHNKHTQQFIKALEWIIVRTEHSLLERVEQMQRLTEFEGPAVLGMRAYTGWN